MLSPAAQSARTESGGAAQRRYTDRDVAYFRKAKALLDSGMTFEQTLEALQALEPGELEQAVEAVHRVWIIANSASILILAPAPIQNRGSLVRKIADDSFEAR